MVRWKWKNSLDIRNWHGTFHSWEIFFPFFSIFFQSTRLSPIFMSYTYMVFYVNSFFLNVFLGHLNATSLDPSSNGRTSPRHLSINFLASYRCFRQNAQPAIRTLIRTARASVSRPQHHSSTRSGVNKGWRQPLSWYCRRKSTHRSSFLELGRGHPQAWPDSVQKRSLLARKSRNKHTETTRAEAKARSHSKTPTVLSSPFSCYNNNNRYRPPTFQNRRAAAPNGERPRARTGSAR